MPRPKKRLPIKDCVYSPSIFTDCTACRRKLGDAKTPCDLIAEIEEFKKQARKPRKPRKDTK